MCSILYIYINDPKSIIKLNSLVPHTLTHVPHTLTHDVHIQRGLIYSQNFIFHMVPVAWIMKVGIRDVFSHPDTRCWEMQWASVLCLDNWSKFFPGLLMLSTLLFFVLSVLFNVKTIMIISSLRKYLLLS